MTESKKINIAIVDDAKLMIDGWKETFKNDPLINLMCTALNKEAFLKKCRENKDNLDVLILDKNIDGKTQFDDFSFIKEVRKEFTDQKIIVYTWDYYIGHIDYLRQINVNGYLPSNVAANKMAEAIKFVVGGMPYFPRDLESKAADKSRYNNSKQFDIDFIRLVSSLSPGQNKVASLMASDMLNSQIAEKLSISVKAVENQVHKIYEKLHIFPDEEQARSKFNHYFGEYFRCK